MGQPPYSGADAVTPPDWASGLDGPVEAGAHEETPASVPAPPEGDVVMLDSIPVGAIDPTWAPLDLRSDRDADAAGARGARNVGQAAAGVGDAPAVATGEPSTGHAPTSVFQSAPTPAGNAFAPSPSPGPGEGVIGIDAHALDAAASALRRASNEIQALVARLGSVRAGLGLAPGMQAMVEETVGRHGATLGTLAAELDAEAADLIRRAGLASE